jgi:hypothetical protein
MDRRERIGLKLATLSAAALLLTTGLEVRAQGCEPLANEIRNLLPGEALTLSIVSAQSNAISTYADTASVKWDPQSQRIVAYTSGNQTFSDRRYFYAEIIDTLFPPMRFSAQNFATVPANAVEQIKVYMAGDVSSVSIHNLTWNYWIQIDDPTCSDGILYGFGTPVGNDGSASAMYIISPGVHIGEIG